MAIPDFQTLTLPLLRFISDGKTHTNREVLDALANEFKLTDDERRTLLPSGQQPVFNNRLHWARAHFRKAGLIENVSRGVFRITPRGREVLAENAKRIDLRYLDWFPEHRAWRSKESNSESGARSKVTEEPPAEAIESAYENIRENLVAEILQH